MFSEAFLESQKKKLLEEETRLLNSLREVAVYNAQDSTWTPLSPEYDRGDPEDLGDAAEEATVLRSNEARMNDLLISLREVRAALKKMGEGRYGFCENCGQVIDEKRLLAYPAAQTCLKCQPQKKLG